MSKYVGKWNPKTREYESYDLPEGSSLMENDLEQKVSCASCGKIEKYGNLYTSRHIHTQPYGFGYMVCKDCNLKERELELKYD